MLKRVMTISLIGLLLLPLILSVTLIFKTINDYQKSEIISGKVISCISRELKTGNPPRVYINHYKKVETERGSIVTGSYGYSREDSCRENIGRVYSFRDFFLMPLLILLFNIVLYGVIYKKKMRYKKISKTKKPK